MALDLLRPREFGVGRGTIARLARGLVMKWSHSRSERAIRGRSRPVQVQRKYGEGEEGGGSCFIVGGLVVVASTRVVA